MNSTNQHTACIIGGGMSGLITGALLAKNGYKVTVLEKNTIIGGGLQSFRRGDAVFNTGMQVLCGYDEHFALPHLFRYFGISDDKVKFSPLDPVAHEIIWVDAEHCYRLPKTRCAYEEYLISCFPHEASGIHQFLDAVYEIGNAFDYVSLRAIRPHPEIVQYSTLTGEQLLRKYITDELLIRLLEYIGMHLGYNLAHVTAIDLGMILALYIEGSWRVAGGNIALAKAIADVIISHGGQVLNESKVQNVQIHAGKIEYVETTDGNYYYADQFVCAIAPKLLLSMTNEQIFRKSTYERISSYASDSSGILLSIQLKPQVIKFQNHLIFLPSFNYDKYLPIYISMLTPVRKNQDEWAETLEVLMFTHYSNFKKWESTLVSHRGEDYENYKQQIGERILSYISQFYPEIKGAVQNIYVATPLTLLDYYGNPHGATFGQQGVYIPIRTRIYNLFMTGQAVQYQGLFGTALTSILTVETLLGRTIVEEIAKA